MMMMAKAAAAAAATVTATATGDAQGSRRQQVTKTLYVRANCVDDTTKTPGGEWRGVAEYGGRDCLHG